MSFLVPFYSLHVVCKTYLFYADMWPKQLRTPHAKSSCNNPLRQESVADEDEDVRIQSELPTFGSAPQGPGIPIEDYADFLEIQG